jgi:hypothetical protein
MCGDILMKFGDLNVSDFMVIVNSGAVSLIKELELIEVEGNINSRRYINILDTFMARYIALHFPTDEYLYQDDNAPVHASRETKRWKQETILNV